MTLKQAEKLTGEFVLLIPLFLLTAVLGIFPAAGISMLIFFLCKWAYDKTPASHLHLDKTGCAVASYGVFLAVGLIYSGLTLTSPYMKNQPMVIIVLTIAATWVWAAAGDIQYSFVTLQHELSAFKNKPPFKCATATAEEISARCLELGKSDEYAEFMIAVYRSGKTQKEIAADYGLAAATVKEYKRKRSRELEGRTQS